MTIEKKIIAKLHDCGNINKVAKYYDVPKEYVKKLRAALQKEEAEYRKVLNSTRLALPRHKDEKADILWEAAFKEGRL
jgi:hypothetical protein